MHFYQVRLAKGKSGRGMKRVVIDNPLGAGAKKQKKMSRSEQLVHLPSHRRFERLQPTHAPHPINKPY